MNASATHPTSATHPPGPISQAECEEISDQLARVLTSPWFRTSSRCSQLLRHVVELSIQGQAERLKERQIAVEAFHRKPTYDNNSDPVVRVAAGEVRKRLAQYYGAPENAGQIRIELPIGSYAPVFHLHGPAEAPPEAHPLSETPAATALEESHDGQELAAAFSESEQHAASPAPTRVHPVWLGIAAGIILIAAAAGIWRALKPLPQSGFDTFWAPILSSPSPAIISVGDMRASDLTFVPDPQRSPHSEAFEIQIPKDINKGIAVEPVGFVQAAAKVASVLGSRGKAFEVLDQSQTTFADFAGRPTVLIGAYDNDWAMGLTSGRRFEFKIDSTHRLGWISDRKKPGAELGPLNISSPEPSTYDTYSIVMRDTGSVSRQHRVILASVGDEGTLAAAEFVSNPRYLDDFARHAPKDWTNKNIEILIQTRVIENVLGIPTVIDYNIW